MNITLTKVYRSDTDKAGNKRIDKNGKPYTKLGIKCNEYGEKWLSGFESGATKNWKEGDKVEVEVEQRGEYLNFKPISETQKLWNAITTLNKKILELEVLIHNGGKVEDGYPKQQGHVEDDIPF